MANSLDTTDIGEIERMNEEIIELREDNQRLKNMCSLVERMNDILKQVVDRCRCRSGLGLDSEAELKILRDKYNVLKESENELTTYTNSEPQEVNSSIVAFDDCLLNESIYDIDVQNSPIVTKHRRRLADKQIHKLKPKTKKSNKTNGKPKGGINGNPKPEKRKTDRPKHVSCDWPGCQMKFRDTYNLSVHKVRHTGEKVFVCEADGCQKTYATKSALDVHHNSHSDNRRFKCTYGECGEAFFRKSQLSAHVSQCHTREFRYRCDWPGCDYQGSYLNRLNSHKLSHTGAKPYRCEWDTCAATFRVKHHLKAHMLKHTGEKPVKCDMSSCDKRFQSRQSMRFHFDKCHRKGS